MGIPERKAELMKESEEIQKQLQELDQKKNQLIQRAIELRGAYSELVRFEKENEPTSGGVENANS